MNSYVIMDLWGWHNLQGTIKKFMQKIVKKYSIVMNLTNFSYCRWKLVYVNSNSEGKKCIFSSFFQGFVTVNGKSVSKADLLADNGIIHYVTDVIYPLVNRDIPALLASDGRFGMLLTAIEMAGMGDLLTQGKYY